MSIEQLIMKENNIFLFADLFAGDLACGFSEREDGNMSLYYGSTFNSLRNRRNFLKKFNIDYQSLVCAKQVHGLRVRVITASDRGRGALSYDTAFADTDAFITSARNVPLAIFSADCPVVFLYDPAPPAIGLVHPGWRSTKDLIAARAVALMRKQFNTRPQDLYAGVSACIRDCCYKVGRGLKRYFPAGIIDRKSGSYLDLVQVNRKQLLRSGVKDPNIFDSRVCTFCQNKNFFSYRKDGNLSGRMMSVIMLR